MGRTALVFGLISGFIMVCLQWIIYPLCYHGYISLNNSYVGYAGMLIAFSVVFFGIKSFRDNQGGGSITFWKGVKIGLMITLVASLVHAAGWHAYNAVNPDFKEFFIQKYTEYKVAELPQPAPQESLDAIKHEVKMLRTVYENPLLDFLVSTVFILPVGIIVTIVSALLLRRTEFLPAGNEPGN